MRKIFSLTFIMAFIMAVFSVSTCQGAGEQEKPSQVEGLRLPPTKLPTLSGDALDQKIRRLEKELEERIRQIKEEARQRQKKRRTEYLNTHVYPEMLRAVEMLIANNRHDQALPILKKLAEGGFQPAKTALYLGMVAAKQGRYAEALTYFQEAASDSQVAQEAKYQQSLVLAAQGKLRDSRTVLQEVIFLNPQSTLAGLSRGYVTTLDQRLREQQRLRLEIGTGFEYDSNVTLQPDASQSAQFISGKGDLLYFQRAQLEFSLFPAKPYDLLLQYSYYQNFHRRLSAYDLLTHTLGPNFTYTFPNSKLWVPFNFNYTDLQSDKYYTAFNLAPIYLHMVTPQVGLEAGFRFTRSYYWLPIYVQNFDRSGPQVGGSLGGYYFFPHRQGFLQARFGFNREISEGSDYVNSAFRFLMAASYNPIDRLKLGASMELGIQPYDNHWVNGTSLSYPKRLDKFLLSRMDVTLGIYQGLEFNTHYYFETYNSNIPLFSYNRHLVGSQLAYRY